jgi:osmotically-inducible protein OsmY
MRLSPIKPIALLTATGVLFAAISSVRASDADAAIVTSAKESYVFKTFLKDDQITTGSKDGVVTLTGSVTDARRSALAEDTVSNLPGVRSVDNQLTIKSPPSNANADWWTSFNVKSLLMFHRDVSGTATEVNTLNGVVTLTGEASSLAQKELTTEYAMDVDGVTSVDNKLTIAAPQPVREQTAAEKLDDASITAQVKGALMSHRSTSALSTSVATKNGVVTLGGIAKNNAEKSLVTKLVQDVHGVSQVVNEMTVAAAATSQR